MRDLGWELQVPLWIGSSAAKGVRGRLGLGRTRHIEVRFLWLQDTFCMPAAPRHLQRTP